MLSNLPLAQASFTAAGGVRYGLGQPSIEEGVRSLVYA